MNKHKTKLFKRVFENNSDCYADTTNDEVIQAMTMETFVPLMGQMWHRAKQKYKNKGKKDTLAFVKWLQKNYHPSLDGWMYRDPIAVTAVEKLVFTTEELYKNWKDERRRTIKAEKESKQG